MEAGWHSEYEYRRLFGVSHDQYLDEPADVIAWMVSIHAITQRVEQDQRRKDAGG